MPKFIFPVFSLILASLLLNGCSDASFDASHANAPAPGVWQLVYQHNANGKEVAGSKEELLNAIRRGAPIRFAWGFRSDRSDHFVSTEHVAEPVFLTIIGESDVVVQLPEHVAQVSYVNADNAVFDKPAVMWRGLLSTKGTFDAVWVNRATGEEVRRLQQRAAVAWFAYQPKDPSARTEPVGLATENGIRPASAAKPSTEQASQPATSAPPPEPEPAENTAENSPSPSE